jgi:hypothetical protein
VREMVDGYRLAQRPVEDGDTARRSAWTHTNATRWPTHATPERRGLGTGGWGLGTRTYGDVQWLDTMSLSNRSLPRRRLNVWICVRHTDETPRKQRMTPPPAPPDDIRPPLPARGHRFARHFPAKLTPPPRRVLLAIFRPPGFFFCCVASPSCSPSVDSETGLRRDGRYAEVALRRSARVGRE